MEIDSPLRGECAIGVVGGQWCFIPPNPIVDEIRKEISKYGNPKQSQLRNSFNALNTRVLSSYPMNVQLFTAYEIFQSHPQLKIIGIYIILHHLEHLTQHHLEDIGMILDTSIKDHAVVESIATKLLFPLIETRPDVFLEPLKAWKDSQKQWRMRACCSAFTRYRKDKGGEQIWEVCEACVHSKDRFVQSGVGCSLKELVTVDEEMVISFIRKNIQYFSRDGLKYSVEKIKDPSVKRELLGLGRTRQSNDPVGARNRLSSEDYP